MLFAVAFYSYSQKVIQMEKENGVYKIPCFVNGAKMKFIFDTGAATVCLSQTMAEYLLENDYITIDDFLGVGQSSVADGRIVDHQIINLRDIEIAGMHLINVQASVILGLNAPLLLGQTAIQELGRITIEGDKLIICNAENDYTESQIDKLLEQADKFIDNESYAAAIECLVKVDNNWGLSAYRLSLLAYSYIKNRQFDNCLIVCNRWIREHEKTSDDQDKSSIYGYMAVCYYFEYKDYNQAILWSQKKIFFEEGISDTSYDKSRVADCFCELERYSEANTMYEKAIKSRLQFLGYSILDACTNKVLDDVLVLIFHSYSVCLDDQKNAENANYYLKLAAKCGDDLAIKYCNKYGVSFY